VIREGRTVTEVAAAIGVSRRSLHASLGKYEADGMEGLNRNHAQSNMELSEAKLQLIPETDRRAVDPPIEVEAATWSAGGQLDWWV
jgi:transposase